MKKETCLRLLMLVHLKPSPVVERRAPEAQSVPGDLLAEDVEQVQSVDGLRIDLTYKRTYIVEMRFTTIRIVAAILHSCKLICSQKKEKRREFIVYSTSVLLIMA